MNLGTLGGTSSEAFDINSSNQVVGQSRLANGDLRAFRFADSNGDGEASPGELRDLGVFGTDVASYAYGINDAGVVVGASKAGNFGRELAVRFDVAAGTVADLGLGAYSAAYDVNASGTIAGYADAGGGQNRGVVRSANGASVAYYSVPGAATTEGLAINDAGVIAGRAVGPNGNQAFVRSAAGAVTEVGFARTTGRSNQASDINAAGLIAGEGVTPADQYRASLQTVGGTAQALAVPTGFRSSYALGVNNRGDAVGALDFAPSPGSENVTHAFVYTGGQVVDLNRLISSESEWLITEARAINDAGYIVGIGQLGGGGGNPGLTRAVMLVPMPGVSTVTVNGGGAQRSMVNSVAVTFSVPVQIDAGAFKIVQRPVNGVGGGTVAGVSFTMVDEQTYTVTINAAGLIGKSLADGIYDLTVVGAKVHDLTSATGTDPLDGDFHFAFHRLYGDADGDGDADALDLFQLRSAVNKSRPNAAYKFYFDYDDSGTIDNADLLQIRSRLTKAFKGY